MTDPLSLVALGAAVGGAAGKFAEKAWDAGEKWLTTYFKNHHQKAQEQAKVNAADFLADLAQQVKKLEESNEVPRDRIEGAQEHPDFSVALQKALLSAAQTDDKDKHQLLARLLADRLKAAPESLIALATKMACDAIAFTTPGQLKILGFDSVLLYVMPGSSLPEDQYNQWLSRHLEPFRGLEIRPLDFIHLEALSCLKIESFMGRDIEQVLRNKNKGAFDAAFLSSALGVFVKSVWNEKGLQGVTLTSIGQIIGVYASDLLTGTTTQFTEWY